MAVSRYPFSEFRSFSRLFSTYAGEFAPVSSYFAGDYRDPRQRGQIAMQVADHFANREVVQSVLYEQNRTLATGDAAQRNIDRLGDSDAVAVVTGQQLGLFLGPLYTIYKTMTAVQLASRMEKDYGRPVIPVFWLEGEDHDIDEVASTTLFASNELRTIRYDAGSAHDARPVGRVPFGQNIVDAIAELENILPPTDFRDAIMEPIRRAYAPERTFQQAFTAMMVELFGDAGIVFVSGDDPRLKRLASPLFKRELREFDKSHSLLKRTGIRLEEAFHVQVRSEPTNLFLIRDEERRSLVAEGDTFSLKGTEDTLSFDEVNAIIDAEPESVSPNVVLRPVYQDTVLPTAAYVAGPGEVAYFAQFRGIYEWASVPMPIIYPRASVTLVESKIQKILDRFKTDVPAFEEQSDRLFHSLVLDAMDLDADAVFERAGRHLHDAVNTVTPAIESVDKSLVKSAESTRAALMKEWERLKDRVIKAEKRRHDQTQDQLLRTALNLFPDGALQERLISPLYFVNKYGTDLVDRLIEEIELDTSAHQVITL